MASAAGLSIIVTVFSEGKERNRALSIFAAVTGLGFAVWNDIGRNNHSNIGMEMGV